MVKSPGGSSNRSRLSHDAATLYAAHVLGLLVPLLTVPFLARVLRPEGWGLVIFAQSFGAWMALVLEYGFDLSGTRAVARVREEPARLPSVVAGIQGARLIILVGLSVVVALVFAVVPVVRTHKALFLAAWAFAVMKGLSPLWYFFGQERMRGPAALDAAARVLAALAVFAVVRTPDDAWKVVALQAMGAGVSLTLLSVWMYRQVPLLRPDFQASAATLKEATGVFLFRGASGLYLQANAFILGLLAAPAVVGFFGSAERLIRAAVNLLHPLSQALFPRLSHLVHTDPRAASKLLGLGLLAMLGGGLVMGVVAAAGAPLLVDVLLGPGYDSVVPVLRVLAFLPPIIAVGTILGIQWALPAGLESTFTRIVLVAGMVNVVLAVVTVPIWGALGMAVSVVVAETLVACGLLALFHLRGGRLRPFAVPSGARSEA